MLKTPINLNITTIPPVFHPLISNADIYDSSCSATARVYFIDKDDGYYLKTSPKGTLSKEATMTNYFAQKGLSANVLEYLSEDKDWMLTTRIHGEDCTHAMYLEDPKRLCDTLSERLYLLHSLDCSDCPVKHTASYLATAKVNYKKGLYDPSYSPEISGSLSADDAYNYVLQRQDLLFDNVLLHGDYCLPNVMLDDWKFSAFIDVGNGGVGDRHVDVYWGIWTLSYNLKTQKYTDRFIYGYGKSLIDMDKLKLISVIEAFG